MLPSNQMALQIILILFDEFGRYLQFASEKPHIAGDAALQQLYEGVQDNAEKCFLLCFVQYELKAYISRVSNEKKSTINRFIGRYETGKKYYLSTNVETRHALSLRLARKFFVVKFLIRYLNLENQKTKKGLRSKP
ncbi:Uncharacterized protein dnl_05480 [Desulfonema limicola]|uniref:Uncharacterized protein n=1 Tax=Desulfonema limicola TaxID=45656 RepID=A0A975GEK8_9BACT|nr:hypothetical protein [Desulfonema limicola]QTA78327.1 Uncharacterized protein dnl_05480 [Desulfonema limicola]